MKRVFKILSSALALCFIAVILCGCHGSGKKSTFEIPEEFDTSQSYEITFWAKNDTNKIQKQIYEKAMADFEALYPNVKVTMRLYTDYSRIYNDVITNIATGTTPNVCITYPDHIATYLTGDNIVVPLDNLLTDEKYGLGGSEVRFDSPKKDEIIEKFLGECYIGESCYALPFMRSTEACYINKTLVEKLGYTLPDVLTWDFIWEVSEAAAKKDSDGNYIANGQKIMIPFIYKSTDNMMIQYLRQAGGELSDSNGNIKLFNDTTKDFLFEIAKHVKSGAFSTFSISSYPGNYLNAGQCVFAIDSTAGSTWMGSDAPLSDIAKENIADFETVVMPIPQVDIESPQMISQGPSVCVFGKEDSQEVLASWLFVQYLLTNEVQIAYSKTEGYVPVTSKAQDSAEYKDYLSRCGEDNDTYYDVKINAAKLLLKNTGNSFVTPVFNGSALVREAAGQLIESTVKSIRRGETVDEDYMTRLYANITSLYRLDQIETGAGGTSGKVALGKLPATAVFLLSALGVAWVFIIVYFVCTKIKNKKSE